MVQTNFIDAGQAGGREARRQASGSCRARSRRFRFSRACTARSKSGWKRSGMRVHEHFRAGEFMPAYFRLGPQHHGRGAMFPPMEEARSPRSTLAISREICGRAVLTGRQRSKTYPLTGPEALTHDGGGRAKLPAATGKTIRYVNVPPGGGAAQAQLAAGMPP